MELMPIVYLAYMLIALYLLSLTLLLYFKNRKTLFEVPIATKNYSVSVLIPAYNEEKTIADTIKAVSDIDYPITEMIVINDGSKDNTLKVIRGLTNKYKNLKIIDKPNSGKADSLNKALKAAKGELVVVVDADSYPERDCFKKLMPFFDDPRVGAATGTCTPRNRKTFLEKLQVIEYKVIAFTRKLLEYVNSIYVVPGTAGVYRKKALEEIGGFDVNNITEDIEATWHLASRGWKIRMCLSANITTDVPNKIKPWYRQRRRWAVGGLQCINKYRAFMFHNGMFGYFIIPFFTIGLILGLIGIGFFAYLFASRAISSFLMTQFSIATGVPVVTANDIYITASVVNFMGISLFLFYLVFALFVLGVMKDRMLEKQSFFNLLFYMVVYMLIYPLVTLTSIGHYLRGRRVWR